MNPRSKNKSEKYFSMPTPDPILVFTRPLNAYRIPYMVTGSSACIVYGEPRLTHDIDMVIELTSVSIPLIIRAFPSREFYSPPEDVLSVEARRPTRGHFNLIHHDTGLKGDCYLIGEDPLHHWGFERRRVIKIDDTPVQFAPPEYVIIRKLEYFREGGSPKHLQDIRGILNATGDTLDMAALHSFIKQRQLESPWALTKAVSTGQDGNPP